MISPAQNHAKHSSPNRAAMPASSIFNSCLFLQRYLT
uniref:Uncharacterized protein n=1 Tax=Rhizophora mucronata TaxID=61149 RepID=A0A2P2JUS6_RHIMU